MSGSSESRFLMVAMLANKPSQVAKLVAPCVCVVLATMPPDETVPIVYAGL